MNYLVPLGRILFCIIFIKSSFGHFSSTTVEYAASHGVPLASIAVPLSGVMALLGGLSVAIGYRAKWGAFLLVLFLVPVTLMMHNYWAISDPMMAQMQEINFFKNLSMLGGTILIWYFGAGPITLDAWLSSRSKS